MHVADELALDRNAMTMERFIGENFRSVPPFDTDRRVVVSQATRKEGGTKECRMLAWRCPPISAVGWHSMILESGKTKGCFTREK